jgi:Icc-related predicted phosphoesterase
MKIYGTSDTHGCVKEINIPECDLLIHSGDICPDSVNGISCQADLGRSMYWLRSKLIPYLETQSAKQVIFTLGNHDWITRQEAHIFNEDFSPKFRIIIDDFCEIGGLKIWGSPWSNQFMSWAWMDEPSKLQEYYERIPEGTDIIISHQPPLGYGSRYYDINTGQYEQIGSQELLNTIDRVQPKAVICGHIHFGFGTYRHNNTTIYNVAFVNESYMPTNQPVEIVL